MVGLYHTTVTDHFEPYVRPQENMAHTETHWFKVYTEAGHGLCVLPAEDTEALSFNCSHFTPLDLTRTKHNFDLVARKNTVVNVDYAHAGIGSHSCGPALLEKYRLQEGRYAYAFRILPMRGEETLD